MAKLNDKETANLEYILETLNAVAKDPNSLQTKRLARIIENLHRGIAGQRERLEQLER